MSGLPPAGRTKLVTPFGSFVLDGESESAVRRFAHLDSHVRQEAGFFGRVERIVDGFLDCREQRAVR